MMEELQKLKKSMALANAKISYLSDGFKELKEQFEAIGEDLDAFIDVFETSQQKINDRLKRIERHVGLD
jgi:hypothetical protein